MSDKPDLKVVPIGLPGLQNVPKMLRLLADAIEEGKYGSWTQVTVVLNSKDELCVFGYGLDTASDACMLLGAGLARMHRPLLEKAT